ncbi:MAG TPA: bifunctional [glutamine synthetase] adenylyltransferase/[glutamine synthetase]-adenylyl-L-tyrosine phosphorylase, partial [Actinoplanes sp.]
MAAVTRPSRLARFGFADNGSRAADLLGPDGLRLWDAGTQEPVDGDAAELINALSRAADPNLALRQLHRIVESAVRSAQRANGGPGSGSGVDLTDPAACRLLDALYSDTGLRRRLVAILGASSALGDHLVANPDEWRVLATGRTGLPPNADGHLELDEAAGGDSTGTGPAGVPALRKAYRLALLRIAAADLTGGRGLEPTMAALSTLADETLAAAYAIAVGELPAGTDEPRLAVVAMGKCGGNELNYVSDVDVIFVAAGDDDLPGATTVAARLIDICGQVAWPVDAALRPEGSRGPLVRTLASHLAYYRRWARTWEFQALLKARPAAGDTGLRRRLVAILGASSALGDHLVANPDEWRVLATGRTGL